MKKYISILIVCIGLLPFLAEAQHATRSTEVGIFLGGSYYIGELNPTGQFGQFTKPAGGVIVRYNLNPRISARANVLFGGMEAHDEFSSNAAQQQRNLSFKSKLNEFSLYLEFNFLDYQIGNEKRKFSPFLFLGLAGFQFAPQGQIGDNWVNLQPLGTEGQGLEGGATKKKYKLVQISIPFGLGIKTNLSRTIGLSIEWGMRKTFTDYLDDVSGKYYDPAKLAAAHGSQSAILSDPSKGTDPNYSNVGRQRGNPTNKDWYSFAGIGLTIKLKPKRETCPAFTY